jgi:glycine cleavage system aminomethyltransferase T
MEYWNVGIDFHHYSNTPSLHHWFEHVAAEHKNARENVVLIDQSSFCKFAVEGPGALAFLNRLCANRIDKPVGKVVYTQMCNERGTIECDLTLGRLAEDFAIEAYQQLYKARLEPSRVLY